MKPLQLPENVLTTFIYVLKEPDTGAIRYVGKSCDPKRRFRMHLTVTAPCHKTNWITSLRLRGLQPVLEVIDEVPSRYWQQWEIAYIEFFRETGEDLTNTTVGGESGPSPLGRVQSVATRLKIAAANTGRKHTKEHRENNAAAQRGKELSTEHGAKISASLIGNTRSLGCKATDARRKAMSEQRQGNQYAAGNINTDAHKKAMADGLQAYWIKRRQQASI